MIIQSGYGVLAYNTPSKVAAQQEGSGITNSSPTSPAKNADQVTLSSAGKALANAERKRSPAEEDMLRAASSDPEGAEKFAKGMAETPSTIFYDISGVGGSEDVKKLSTTGRVIDDAFKSKFYIEASSIDAQRLAIYNSEKAKGTDPVQILSKMIDFNDSQSKDYREASGWGIV